MLQKKDTRAMLFKIFHRISAMHVCRRAAEYEGIDNSHLNKLYMVHKNKQNENDKNTIFLS